mmetsp:Transcript_71012/g.179182  ORF Transcript_71012/g.179182 Transcript_71012/m.179182 type:complete len:162 (+) Transcript_71012:29-514(+)
MPTWQIRAAAQNPQRSHPLGCSLHVTPDGLVQSVAASHQGGLCWPSYLNDYEYMCSALFAAHQNHRKHLLKMVAADMRTAHEMAARPGLPRCSHDGLLNLGGSPARSSGQLRLTPNAETMHLEGKHRSPLYPYSCAPRVLLTRNKQKPASVWGASGSALDK